MYLDVILRVLLIEKILSKLLGNPLLMLTFLLRKFSTLLNPYIKTMGLREYKFLGLYSRRRFYGHCFQCCTSQTCYSLKNIYSKLIIFLQTANF